MYLSGCLVALAASLTLTTATPAGTARAPSPVPAGTQGDSNKFLREPKIVGGFAVRLLIPLVARQLDCP